MQCVARFGVCVCVRAMCVRVSLPGCGCLQDCSLPAPGARSGAVRSRGFPGSRQYRHSHHTHAHTHTHARTHRASVQSIPTPPTASTTSSLAAAAGTAPRRIAPPLTRRSAGSRLNLHNLETDFPFFFFFLIIFIFYYYFYFLLAGDSLLLRRRGDEAAALPLPPCAHVCVCAPTSPPPRKSLPGRSGGFRPAAPAAGGHGGGATRKRGTCAPRHAGCAGG